MSKRYYLCDMEMFHNGDFEELRPAVAGYSGVNFTAQVSVDNAQALVLVDTVNHGVLVADSRIDALPDFPLDAKVNALHSEAKRGLSNAMASRGYGNVSVADSEGYREVIRGIGRSLNPNFHEDNFDISE